MTQPISAVFPFAEVVLLIAIAAPSLRAKREKAIME
jgi:hypothetical protein